MRADNSHLPHLKLRKDGRGWDCTGDVTPADRDDGYRQSTPGRAVRLELGDPGDSAFVFTLDGPIPDFFGPGRPLVTPHPFYARPGDGMWCVSTITTEPLERPIYMVGETVEAAIDRLFACFETVPVRFPLPAPGPAPVVVKDASAFTLSLIVEVLERLESRIASLEPAPPADDRFARVESVQINTGVGILIPDIFRFAPDDDRPDFVVGSWYWTPGLPETASRHECDGPFDTFEQAFDEALNSINEA